MATKTGEGDRGRESRGPTEVPRKGWRDIGTRVVRQQGADNLSIVAAGVGFYALLAIFPALAAAVSVYAMVADPAQVQQQLQGMAEILPQQAQGLVGRELARLVGNSGGALSVGAIGGVLVAFWSASKGTKALLTALNIAYGESEQRGFMRFNAVAFGLTVVAVIGVVLALGLVVVLPIALSAIGLGGFAGLAVSWGRWLVLAIGVLVALAVLYRFGPSRSPPRWQWVTPGSITATLLWLLASTLFSIYVANFGSYNATYGALGAVIILLLWFHLSAYIVLLGAEINSEAERQTRRDSTTGQPMPRGERDARPADTVGEGPDRR